MANGNNAYRNCQNVMNPAGSGNVTVTALSYAADAWGQGWAGMSAAPSIKPWQSVVGGTTRRIVGHRQIQLLPAAL